MRRRKQLAGLVALLFGTLPLHGTPPGGTFVGLRLNDDLAIGTNGDVVRGTQVSPDGNWYFYFADGELFQRYDMYVGPTDLSSPPVRLNDDIGPDDRVRRASFTPDSSRIVYEVSFSNFADGFELYSVLPDGSQPPVLLSPVGISFIRDWDIAPDSSCVVLDTIGLGPATIWSVPVDGSSAPLALTGTPSLNISWLAQRFEISSDSSFVVFREAELSDTIELYRAPIGGGARTRLSQALTNPNAVFDFELSPDGSQVVYRGDILTNNVLELFSAPSDGSGTPVQLSGALVTDGDVDGYAIDATSAHVCFSADALVDERGELYTVPIAGGTPVQLTRHVTAGSDLFDFVIAPDGSRVLFVADMEVNGRGELYSTPVDGSQPLTKLNGPLVNSQSVLSGIQVAPDSSYVAYRRTLDTALFDWILVTAPIDGSQAATPLDTTPIRPQVDFEILPDASRIAFRGLEGGLLIRAEMHTMRPDGTDFLTLSTLSTGFGGVEDFAVMPDSSAVFFRTDEILEDRFELFKAPVDASTLPVSATGPLVEGGVEGDVFNFRISPDGLWTVYQADQDSDERIELYSVPSDASGPPVKLNAELPIGSGVFFDFTPTGDSSRVVFRADQDERGVLELYSVPIDGSAAPTQLSAPLPTGGGVDNLSLAADGSTIVYEADQDVVFENELFAVPADGSGAPVQISGALVPGGTVVDFVYTPAGDQVVYRAGQDTTTEAELYLASLDGSGPWTKISGPLVASGDVGSRYECSASGRTVYLADADVNGVQEIYSAPTDGSQPPVKLNTPLPAFADVLDFRIVESLDLVVYYADPLVDQQGELFSVPIDGSAPPVRLNGDLPVNGDVAEFEVTPDGGFVVFRADATTNDIFELYSVPTVGGQTPTRLHPELSNFQNVEGFSFEPPFAFVSGGKRVVFRGDLDVNGKYELFIAPSDGSALAVRISPEDMPFNRDVDGFAVVGGNRVLYEADLIAANTVDLHLVRAGGLGETLKVNPPFSDFADIRPTTFFTPTYQLTPDGMQVHYIADQLQNNVFELFTTRFELTAPGDTGPRRAVGPLLDGGQRRF